uniref:Calponin-homology (CH) domain-containing protein n=1 Tax=Scophthalmus maximus TaxID=52904 RepID=A0A8D3C3S9_SCOMX
MRMQDKANRGSRKESFGEISDRVLCQVPVSFSPGERNAVQKRTFARWMNVVLQRCDPPLEVHDLFIDIQDGRILMALLEELTGCLNVLSHFLTWKSTAVLSNR